jgi:hypothetical protein
VKTTQKKHSPHQQPKSKMGEHFSAGRLPPSIHSWRSCDFCCFACMFKAVKVEREQRVSTHILPSAYTLIP